MRIETEHRRHEVEAAREAQEATREAARELSDEDETRSPRSPRSLPLPLPLEQADHTGGAHAQLVEGGGYAECSGDEGEDRGEERNESEGESSYRNKPSQPTSKISRGAGDENELTAP